MKTLEYGFENLNLLERREKNLRESRLRTERLLKKATELGIIKTYIDHLGRLQIKAKE